MSSCFFTGHRAIKNEHIRILKSLLREEILRKINDNITIFIAGGAKGFDTIAAEQVLAMRDDFDISLHLYLPCRGHDISWKDDERSRFADILKKADKVFYVSNTDYYNGCMQKRNRAMVDASSCGIAYMTHICSGSSQTVRMAKKRGIPVCNIADSFELYAKKL